jgi:hypothetical protein
MRNEEILERSKKKPVGTAKRCFRGKVVGSNPAGPTKAQTSPRSPKAYLIERIKRGVYNIK